MGLWRTMATDQRSKYVKRLRRGQCMAVMALLVVSAAAADDSDTVRVQRYALEVTCHPAESRLEATAEVFFPPSMVKAGELRFYLHDELSVQGVSLGGRAVAYTTTTVDYAYSYTSKALRCTVQLPTPVRGAEPLVVRYAGRFSASSARAKSDYMRIDAEGVLLRGYGYTLWYPEFLPSGAAPYGVRFDPVRIRVPEAYVPIFVGRRVSERVMDGVRVAEWRCESVETLSVQLTARPYGVASAEGVSVYHLRDSLSGETAGKIIEDAQGLLERFSRRYGRQEALLHLHIMQMPEHGDIFSANVIGISASSWKEAGTDANLLGLLAHELVHAYVQRRPPANDPLYALAFEGFPSYFHLPVLAELLGEDEYARVMDWHQRSYLERKARAAAGEASGLPPEKPLYEIKPEEIGYYKDVFVLGDRALLFFDWLRRRAGDEAFFDFAGELFRETALDRARFEQLVRRHFRVSAEELRTWMETTEYPESFRRP